MLLFQTPRTRTHTHAHTQILRHFVLSKDKTLKYFEGTRMKGTIPLQNSFVSEVLTKQRDNCFAVETRGRWSGYGLGEKNNSF